MKLYNFFTICALIILFTGCSTYKQVAYIQDSDVLNDIEQAPYMYDAKIMPKDLLTITVNTTDPQAAAPFNLTVQTSSNSPISSLSQQTSLQQYLVNNDGSIDFPVLGNIKVGGLTKSDTEDLIREMLRDYLKETPIVTVRMTNYKISVLGEVANPGMFTINNEKVNIFEALALAGDLTIYGMRNNVKLIRENAQGHRSVINLNLNKSDIITSPYYYLQQNDILYVTPNKVKAKNSGIGQSASLWLSGASILITLVNLVATIILL